VPLSDEDIREILRMIDETPLAELRLETDGFSLHVVKGGAEEANHTATAATAPRPIDNLVTIGAPMLGVFYQADSPGSQPFVESGSHVGPETTVCIIEVMKMMNSVPAGVTGTVVEVCQENAAIVEEGAPLFRVRPE
jgi:acetyl-CoA carboxylase biotin carboxyl carrier protein